MSEYEKILLKHAYDNYLKTSELECKYLPANGDMLMSFLSAAESLQDDNYIEVYSDNLNSVISDDIIIWYRLTQKGLHFVQANFE